MSEHQPPVDPLESGRTQAGTGVLEREELREQAAPGDAERYAHYVKKEKITSASVTGGPVVALCGKVWSPSRDPKKYPVCPACKEIFESLGKHGQHGDGAGGFFGFDGTAK
ncbi:DUF3039 domain-containing protein [Pseudactinotalea sp. HY160]|uniref:DUF3039 domain-containing protein n=1 Tax=Pseudactinotalea sp. HY160 TaxID=2654490 RepID=UPI00128BBBED|nr:DUF3039 domain-containing protein [Pseudactinotalea sp. HY160]MPV50203.1 DUF3039 domain-containing protein [Pseudactinotalea sp. HY160]